MTGWCVFYLLLFVVQVSGPPNITDISADQTVKEGNDLTLKCTASGNPAPNTTWIKLTDNSIVTMPLTNIRRTDEGGYRCSAYNGVGNLATKDVFITVYYQPSITSVTPFTKQSWIGQNVLLSCVADGSPTPSITWKKPDGTELRKVTYTEKKVDAQMKADQDFGNYTCEARNVVGAAAPRLAQLNQISVPEPVTIVGDEIDSNKITLSWNKPEQNGAAITQYTIYKRIASDKKWTNVGEVKDISNRVFVAKVEDKKKHELVVTASNKYGESVVTTKNIKIMEMPYGGATPRPVESQKGSCSVLHIFYTLFIVFLVIIIIVLSVVIWKMRRRPCPRCGDLIPMNPVSLQVKDNLGLPSDLNTKESASLGAGSGSYMPLHPYERSWEVSQEHVHVIKIIGKGAFSQVAQATLKNVREHQEERTVAVKMLKANAPPSDRKDLLSELELMKKMKPHPHVIKLIGCVTESEPLMVLIEYVPFGDLLGYLRKSRGLNDTYYKDPDVQPETNLTSEQLIKFAWQVADGMCYLCSKKIVHRDLAARNVLVGEGERCKVTDFGMARNVGQDDIYTKKSRGRLPVKWTAFEALLYGVYTTQSDVWSYGILLYEVLTIGGSPYPDTNARLIADKLQQGYRMPKPRHVDSKLYEIMMKCWEEDPSDRPTFEKLRRTMKDMERNHKTYVNLSQYDTRMYANVTDLTAE
ncbi:fibroblast growth factor receptor 4-like isoform X2 [Montipora foliosa]|uniref:fibroblast growth factor receptor 4-like isoform X2 n=1 Tax=Montipora foliosa TaxID=591990 RepID=UPI0035F105B7